MIITATGTLVSDRGGIRLQFSDDLAKLWNWHLLKHTGMIFHTAKRCSKVGIYRPESYHEVAPDWSIVKSLRGNRYKVQFDLSNMIYLHSRKGYWVYFIQVVDPTVYKIISDLGLDKNFDEYNLPHMSISNTKYANPK